MAESAYRGREGEVWREKMKREDLGERKVGGKVGGGSALVVVVAGGGSRPARAPSPHLS